MSILFPTLIGLAMALTLGVLAMGLFGMTRARIPTSQAQNERANKLMRWRVGLQFVAIVLFAFAMLLGRG